MNTVSVLFTYDTTFEAYQRKLQEDNLSVSEEVVLQTMSSNDREIDFLIRELKKRKVEVIFVNHDYGGDIEANIERIAPLCQQATLIFHTTLKVGKLQCKDEIWKKQYQQRLQTYIVQNFLHKSSIFGDGYLVTKVEQAEIAQQHHIPMPETFKMEDYLKNPFLPVVVKRKIGHRANQTFYFDRQEQLELFFDPSRNQQCNLNPLKENYIAQRFVKAPTDFFTTYRVITAGNGKIMGCTLFVSDNKKSEQKRVAIPPPYTYEDTLTEGFREKKEQFSSEELTQLKEKAIYHHVFSPLYLGLFETFSNTGEMEIPLYPTQSQLMEQLNSEQIKILVELGIDTAHIQIPSKLEELAIKTAKVFANYGLVFCGQDWIQAEDGAFYFLEINRNPARESFRILFPELAKLQDRAHITFTKYAECIAHYFDL